MLHRVPVIYGTSSGRHHEVAPAARLRYDDLCLFFQKRLCTQLLKHALERQMVLLFQDCVSIYTLVSEPLRQPFSNNRFSRPRHAYEGDVHSFILNRKNQSVVNRETPKVKPLANDPPALCAHIIHAVLGKIIKRRRGGSLVVSKEANFRYNCNQ